MKPFMILLANRLYIPEQTQAILWDMDGVLLDSLEFDVIICNQLISRYFGDHINLSEKFIRSLFAYHPEKFWRLILNFVKNKHNIADTQNRFDEILSDYNHARNNFAFKVNVGVREILENAVSIGLKMAIVSNNSTQDIKKILSQSGIIDYFDHIIGNDIHDCKKKPAPDTYIFASKIFGIQAKNCFVIEDSLLGAQAGYKAGCFTIGVATGGNNFDSLEHCKWTNQVYSSFHTNSLLMRFGLVTKKNIFTPNDFISHMIEHIAWRIGIEIDLYWNNNDWFLLGKIIGKQIERFGKTQNTGVALGMIDDGSAEVLIELSDERKLQLDAIKYIDLDWFLSLRCEQLRSGKPLIQLLEGFVLGLNAKICVRICSVEDPHHTWEGIFRAIGIALNQIFTPIFCVQEFDNYYLEENVSKGDVSINARSFNFAMISRKTAETNVIASVDFTKQKPFQCNFNVSSTINVDNFQDLMKLFAEGAGFTTQIDFNAKALSSSHVVMEDTGLALGIALKEIFKLRMQHYGINGAGSSISNVKDFENQRIRIALSVEGRKFWRFVPFQDSFEDIRKNFIIGQNICNGLFSEDLDDFVDGFSNGLNCSVIIHIKQRVDPETGWKMIFENLGKAVQETFKINPSRKGVSAGVKATLS